jgi:ABC-type sugar transport system ATPase subunit
VRAVLQRPVVLLLDESTSALDVRVRDRLFELVRELSRSGGSVMFISHRMDEIEEIADRVTVLRSGHSVSTLDRPEVSPRRLLSLMSGSDVMPEVAKAVPSGQPRESAVVLSARALIVREGAGPIDVDIAAGEIIGLGGLEGHGQHEFIECLAGLVPPVAGSIVRHSNGRSSELHAGGEAERSDIAYVPRDRKREGIFAPLSALDNFAVPSLEDDARAGVIRSTRLTARFRRFANQFAVVVRPSTRITALSGGNQQKLLMARWLATSPRILLLNDPTRGVDHATKQDIYQRLREIAQDGIAVVMISTEVDELVGLMDRVLIFRNGWVFETFEHGEADRHRIVASYFGQPRAA